MPALVKISYASVNADGAQVDADRVRAALGRLNTETRGLGAAGEGSTRGLTAVRRGLSELAFQATGVPGPIGRISEGLLQFGAGHIVVLGAVAGLASVALAIRAMTAPTDTVTKSLEAFTKSLKDSRDAGERLRDILDEIPVAQAKTLGFLQGAQGIINFGSLGDAMANAATFFANRSIAGSETAAQAARDALAAARHDTAVKAIQDLETQTALLGQNAEAIIRVRAAQEHWNAADTEAAVLSAKKHESAVQALADLKAQEEILGSLASIQAQINDLLADPTLQGTIRQIAIGLPIQQAGTLETLEQLASRAPHFLGSVTQEPGRALANQFGVSIADIGRADAAFQNLNISLASSAEAAEKAALAHQLAAVQIVNAVSGLIATIVSGGSAGGIIAGIGGVLGFVNPVAGAIVSGLGSIIMAADSNQERRHGELLRALEPVGELLFIVAQSGGDAASLDSLVRRMEQATGRRISVRFGGT